MTTKKTPKPRPKLQSSRPATLAHLFVTNVARGFATTIWPPFMLPRRMVFPPQWVSQTEHKETQSIQADASANRDHTDFSESTDEVAALTEEEKKARLEELRERLKAKRDVQSVQDKENARRNEVGHSPLKLIARGRYRWIRDHTY